MSAANTSKPFRSALRCIPVRSASCTFRLELQALGKSYVQQPTQTFELEFIRHNEKWIMKVTRHSNGDYMISLQAPASAVGVTYRAYQRTNAGDTEFKPANSWLEKGRQFAEFFIGAEVYVPCAAVSKSPWNFTSSEEMLNWDVVLCVAETKFYAHKSMLSFMSGTFRSMFEGEFREKDQPEVPVNVDGIGPDHFEAFLQCLYPGGNEPEGEFITQLVTLADFYNVKQVLDRCVDMVGLLPKLPKMELLRTVIKINCAALEDEVIATFTKDDVQKLLASDLGDSLDSARWRKIVAKVLAL